MGKASKRQVTTQWDSSSTPGGEECVHAGRRSELAPEDGWGQYHYHKVHMSKPHRADMAKQLSGRIELLICLLDFQIKTAGSAHPGASERTKYETAHRNTVFGGMLLTALRGLLQIIPKETLCRHPPLGEDDDDEGERKWSDGVEEIHRDILDGTHAADCVLNKYILHYMMCTMLVTDRFYSNTSLVKMLGDTALQGLTTIPPLRGTDARGLDHDPNGGRDCYDARAETAALCGTIFFTTPEGTRIRQGSRRVKQGVTIWSRAIGALSVIAPEAVGNLGVTVGDSDVHNDETSAAKRDCIKHLINFYDKGKQHDCLIAVMPPCARTIRRSSAKDRPVADGEGAQATTQQGESSLAAAPPRGTVALTQLQEVFGAVLGGILLTEHATRYLSTQNQPALRKLYGMWIMSYQFPTQLEIAGALSCLDGEFPQTRESLIEKLLSQCEVNDSTSEEEIRFLYDVWLVEAVQGNVITHAAVEHFKRFSAGIKGSKDHKTAEDLLVEHGRLRDIKGRKKGEQVLSQAENMHRALQDEYSEEARQKEVRPYLGMLADCEMRVTQLTELGAAQSELDYNKLICLLLQLKMDNLGGTRMGGAAARVMTAAQRLKPKKNGTCLSRMRKLADKIGPENEAAAEREIAVTLGANAADESSRLLQLNEGEQGYSVLFEVTIQGAGEPPSKHRMEIRKPGSGRESEYVERVVKGAQWLLNHYKRHPQPPVVTSMITIADASDAETLRKPVFNVLRGVLERVPWPGERSLQAGAEPGPGSANTLEPNSSHGISLQLLA